MNRAQAVAAAVARDDGCVMRGVVRRGMDWQPPIVCSGGLEGHEVIRRSQGGDPNDPAHVLTLCSAHHRFATLNPQAGWEWGLVAWGWEGVAGLADARERRLARGMVS